MPERHRTPIQTTSVLGVNIVSSLWGPRLYLYLINHYYTFPAFGSQSAGFSQPIKPGFKSFLINEGTLADMTTEKNERQGVPIIRKCSFKHPYLVITETPAMSSGRSVLMPINMVDSAKLHRMSLGGLLLNDTKHSRSQ